MLVTDDLLFLHPPKTAGMAITQFLIRHLPGKKLLYVPKGHEYKHPDVTCVTGSRHETLADAARRLTAIGRTLDDFKAIIATIRNPYEIEVSRFHYLRLGHPYDAGPDQKLAIAGDFLAFCRDAPYPWRPGIPIERWFTLDGVMPSNLRILRQETLDDDLRKKLGDIAIISERVLFVNVTKHDIWQTYITAEIESIIFDKLSWLFQFYDRYRPDTRV